MYALGGMGASGGRPAADNATHGGQACAAVPTATDTAPQILQVPDMNKRNVMNLLLAGGVGLPIGGLAVPFALFFVPVRWVGGDEMGATYLLRAGEPELAAVLFCESPYKGN